MFNLFGLIILIRDFIIDFICKINLKFFCKNLFNVFFLCKLINYYILNIEIFLIIVLVIYLIKEFFICYKKMESGVDV